MSSTRCQRKQKFCFIMEDATKLTSLFFFSSFLSHVPVSSFIINIDMTAATFLPLLSFSSPPSLSLSLHLLPTLSFFSSLCSFPLPLSLLCFLFFSPFFPPSLLHSSLLILLPPSLPSHLPPFFPSSLLPPPFLLAHSSF